MTAGIAKMIMNDVTTSAQTKSRDPVQRHAGRALFEYRNDDLDRADQRGNFGHRDHLRPQIDPFARRIFRADNGT